jgi:hypothetical protein
LNEIIYNEDIFALRIPLFDRDDPFLSFADFSANDLIVGSILFTKPLGCSFIREGNYGVCWEVKERFCCMELCVDMK